MTVASAPGDLYPADLADGGVTVLWRTVHTWQQIIDEWTIWLIAAHYAAATVYQRRWQTGTSTAPPCGCSPAKATGV